MSFLRLFVRLLDRDVAVYPPQLEDRSARVAAGNDVPIAIPENGEIGFPVAIVVSRHGNVSGYPPQLEDRNARVAAGNDVPIAIPENGDIGFPVAIVVSRHGNGS